MACERVKKGVSARGSLGANSTDIGSARQTGPLPFEAMGGLGSTEKVEGNIASRKGISNVQTIPSCHLFETGSKDGERAHEGHLRIVQTQG